MDLKSEDIFNVDIDASIWLSCELDKLNLDIQLDIESALLPVENNKVNEITNSYKDTKNPDLKMSVTNVQTVLEKSTQETELEKRDINGNEESSSDENLVQLFDELELSDTDNEAVDKEDNEAVDNEAIEEEDNETVDEEDNEAVDEEDNEAVDEEDNEAVDEEDNEAVGEEGSGLIERGPEHKRFTKGQNRTNYLPRKESYDKSEFPPRSLEFWSGSTVVQSYDTPLTVIEPILNIRETNLTSSSDSLSSPSPVVYDDLRASAFGSPESGYESSITGSPPQVSSFSDLFPEIDDIDLFLENTPGCALIDHNIQRCDTDDKDRKKKIIELINYLKDIPNELNESSNACSNKDCVPSVNSNNNSCSGNSSPRLRHVDNHKRIEYKLENKARTALYQFLSDTEYKSTQERIYRQINNDIANHREIKIIQVVDEVDGTSENRTNLHHAVINSYIEEIFCLVEIQKQYRKPLSDINIRDRHGKTALDYAVKNKMTLVVDYLKENTACQSLNI